MSSETSGLTCRQVKRGRGLWAWFTFSWMLLNLMSILWRKKRSVHFQKNFTIKLKNERKKQYVNSSYCRYERLSNKHAKDISKGDGLPGSLLGPESLDVVCDVLGHQQPQRVTADSIHQLFVDVLWASSWKIWVWVESGHVPTGERTQVTWMLTCQHDRIDPSDEVESKFMGVRVSVELQSIHFSITLLYLMTKMQLEKETHDLRNCTCEEVKYTQRHEEIRQKINRNYSITPTEAWRKVCEGGEGGSANKEGGKQQR